MSGESAGGAPTQSVVLIVGAGPTGLLLAAELHRRGVACRIIDEKSGPMHWDRATVIHPRSLEVFEALGLLDRFLDAGARQLCARVHANGALLGEIDLAACGSRHGFNLGLSEEVTESILTDYLHAQGGEVERSSRLVDLEQRSVGVAAVIEGGGGNRDEAVFEWVVGCDGLHSLVRGVSGIALEGHDIEHPWAVFDATLRSWPEPYEANYVYLDELPVILTALPGHRWRVYLRPSSPDSDLVGEASVTIFRYQPGVSIVGVQNLTRFHCHSKVAARFSAGRVLLAGDAAHVCSPAQGHGMNSGIQDAFNLAWKLARVARGQSEPELLESYEAERRPVADRIAQSGDSTEQAQSLATSAARRDRDAELRAVFADPTASHHEAVAEAELDIDYRGSPIVMGDPNEEFAPGDRLPNTILAAGVHGDSVPLHALLGTTAHSALLVGGIRGDAEELLHLESLVREQIDGSVIETVVVAAPVPGKPEWFHLDEGAARELDAGRTTLFVLRPDGHVGLRADHDHVQQLAAYRRLLTTGAAPQ